MRCVDKAYWSLCKTTVGLLQIADPQLANQLPQEGYVSQSTLRKNPEP